MLKFRGFRASLNLSSGKGSGVDHIDKSPGISITGAYRVNRDEIFAGQGFTYPDPPKKITPSMIKLPNSQTTVPVEPTNSEPALKPSKSVNNLAKPDERSNITKSTPNIAQANSNGVLLTKSQVKEQKKLEKQRLAEEKKREKIAAKEQQKQEKLKKEREKQTQIKQEKDKGKKNAAPKQQKQKVEPQNVASQSAQPQSTSKKPKKKPPSVPKTNDSKPAPQISDTSSKPTQKPYSTNTLESSISKSSGPPPYTPMPEMVQNKNDDTGNTSFSKRISEVGSWDMISQHRQQMSRQAAVSKGVPKQKHMDLHYNVTKNDGNSDA